MSAKGLAIRGKWGMIAGMTVSTGNEVNIRLEWLQKGASEIQQSILSRHLEVSSHSNLLGFWLSSAYTQPTALWRRNRVEISCSMPSLSWERR